MIVEFCGLAGTGKSTAVNLTFTYLKEKGYKVKKISNLPFVNLTLNKYKALKILHAIMIAFKNIMLRPMLAILILRYSAFNINGSLKYKIIWLLTSLQYHINWVVKRDKLIKMHKHSASSVIYILDGSPLNLLIEFDDGRIFNKLRRIIFPPYESKLASICVVFTIDSKNSIFKRVNARNRKLEQYLYSDKKLNFFYDNYQNLLDKFEKKNCPNVKYESFNMNNLLNDLEKYLSKYI